MRGLPRAFVRLARPGRPMDVTVLYDTVPAARVAARVDGDHLWLTPQDFETATGWTLKTEGLCQGPSCVPLPRDASWLDGEGRLDLSAFAAAFRRPVVRDDEHAIWAFGERADARAERLLTLEAPDFTLPDLEGTCHSLSDFRGKKVLLLAWGSYCGCRFDLPVWQTLYDELKDQDFEIIAVALDAGGPAAVRESIRPTVDELAAQSGVLAQLMGWGEDEWHSKAPRSTCA